MGGAPDPTIESGSAARSGDPPPRRGPLGGYDLHEVAGRGGMGVVYRATERALRRTVALKVIAPALAGDPRFRALFAREALSAAAVEHPNVVPVYRAGEE